MFSLLSSAVLALSIFTSSVHSAPHPVNTTRHDPLGLTRHTKRGLNVKLALAQNFPDPSIFQHGSSYWAFATTNHNGINVQVATSPDFNSWGLLGGVDALPNPGAWTTGSPVASGWIDAKVWSPNVIYNDNGEWVMYYSAFVASSPAQHCVGVATASNIQGPYAPVGNEPLFCPISQGGAIDASGFHDVDGSRWVVYKIDGNSIGHGGTCGNTVAPIVPTPIMLQRMAGDGITPIGNPIQLLDRSDLDGPLIEAPSISRTPDGHYVIFFSSNCFNTQYYDISYAIADSITGPYTKYGPFAVTPDAGLWAPGGMHVSMIDQTSAVFHSGQFGSRFMYTAELTYDMVNDVVSAS